jgi:4-hydroxy-tetrahydrodipicolinate reductase
VTSDDVSTRVRVALVGMGRMGRAIDMLADARGCDLVARLSHTDTTAGISPTQLNGAQVAIEFTQPDAALRNATACLAAHCPVVVGTTGWLAEVAQLEQAIVHQRCAALVAPNFALGVQIFLEVVDEAARRFRHVTGFDAHIVETHHAEKKDAPSGTGSAIAQRLRMGLDRDVPITSVRTGFVPGTHEVIFDAPFEQIRLVHEARDRRVFADGALVAARWLAHGRQPALYTMRDVVRSSGVDIGA